jgi:RNA polymerase primary sigma factor
MASYSNKAMEELATELTSGLARLRKGYLDAAEQIIQIVQDDQSYPLSFIVFRLTSYRPPDDVSAELIEGSSLRKDLLKLLLDVSASFALHTGDYGEPAYDQIGLAQRFDVSTKTIQRWRNRGLPARRLIFPDGRRRIGFLESSLRWFLHGHGDEIRRSSRFSQLSHSEREDILRRARRMTGFTACSLTDVVHRISTKTGRAPETVRYTLRRHDSEMPENALFPHLLNAMGDELKHDIYRRFLGGVAVNELATLYGRARGTIHRILNEVRAVQLLERSITYVTSEEFNEDDAEKSILAEQDVDDEVTKSLIKPPSDLPPYLRSLYEVPLLSARRERDLFRRYNFLKFKADRLRKQIDMNRVRATDIKAIESLLLQSNELKNQIVRANLRLVVSIAKKHLSGPMTLFELISDGNISLMHAIEKFDYAKGFRFSTYGSWAIMRNFARSVPRERTQQDRFSTGHESILDIASGLRTYDPNQGTASEVRESIDRLLSKLTQRERVILTEHYGLEDSTDSKTFEQIGSHLGISKERVRQIEIQALEKLREQPDVRGE